MKKISSETESRLMKALDTTAAHVNSGCDPTTAVIKAAQSHQLSAGAVTKLCHALNTARVNRQREDSVSVFDKAADVALADPALALETLYPDKVKTAAVLVRESAVSDEYNYPPTAVLRQREREKLASEPLPPLVSEPPKPYQHDPSPAIRKAFGDRDRAKLAIEESRRKVATAYDAMADAFGRLTAACMRTDSVPLAVLTKNATAMYGAQGTQIFEQITAVSPHLVKQAQHNPSAATLSHHAGAPAVGPAYTALHTLVEAISAYKQARDDHAVIEKESSARAEAALAPFAVRGGDPSVLDPNATRLSRSSSGIAKQALPSMWQTLGSFALAKGMFDGIARDLQAPDENKLVQKTLGKLTDPEHEAQLRSINTQATLQDFILNDPVISGHDPEDVMNAFNEITQLAPSISDQRLPLQAVLRKRLQQGALDPFDVDQVLQLEQGLRQRNLIPKPTGTVPTAGN